MLDFFGPTFSVNRLAIALGEPGIVASPDFWSGF
jgi:hypothetical protein